MSRRLLVLFSMLLALLFSSASLAAAQDTATDVDVDAAAEAALDADPEDLVAGLEERPDDSLLPEGFTNPSSGTPENQELVEDFSGGLGTIEDAVGQVTYGFDTDPDVVPGEISTGILTFIVVEDEITEQDMEDYQTGMEEGADDMGQGMEAQVETTEVGGVDAVRLTLTIEQSGTFAVVEMTSIPVGNTMVVSTVLSAGTEEVDPEEVAPLAEELALAGAAHVGEVAEES